MLFSRSGISHPGGLGDFIGIFLQPMACSTRNHLCRHAAHVAFTIRTCSRRTVSWACCQLMACQSMLSWEAAPAIDLAVICFASLTDLTSYLVMRYQVEVCPLSRGMMLQPLSASLPGSFRFLHPPTPAAPSACSTLRLPTLAGEQRVFPVHPR
jgi:hypothetical protein